MNFVAVLRPARVGCPRGLAVVLHPAAVSRAPVQFSSTQEQEPAPATPAISSYSLPQKPWKPRTDPLPPLPRRAGSREWFSWRAIPAARACRDERQPAPPLPPAPVCRPHLYRSKPNAAASCAI